MKFLESQRPRIAAATRIVVGFLFALHGCDKYFGWFSGPSGELEPLMALAGVIELVGGALVCIGLQTRIAAFICSGTMAVAYFIAHQPRGGLPIQNDGELAALYSWVFLLLASLGDGIWSVGAKLRSARS
jgi:putative oxidoreductase